MPFKDCHSIQIDTSIRFKTCTDLLFIKESYCRKEDFPINV